ncbi:SAP30-binding protein-like [Oppia nitens]|uniref:SAP30-binding protein-like n=1 Tax=Oppia nitens TaxID=1686743 RepID=UPI0023DBCC84|nr:SAP30-binding protein-like [Oppia nitens]
MSSHLKQSTALSSLTTIYSDSEDNESDRDSNEDKVNITSIVSDLAAESRTNSPSMFQSIDSLDKRHSFDEQMRDDVYEEDKCQTQELDDDRCTSPITFHKSLFGKTDDQIVIPLEPIEKCSKSLQEKIERLHYKMKMGSNMTTIIQRRKDFRNPSIYEKLIAYCDIDEMATNYPPDVYNPHIWTEKSFYEELAKRQKEDMDRREKDRKERTKVEFMSGTKKGPTGDTNESTKKKSKWDLPSNVSTTQSITLMRPQVVIPVTTATGTKPTVISAFGTITKKSK